MVLNVLLLFEPFLSAVGAAGGGQVVSATFVINNISPLDMVYSIFSMLHKHRFGQRGDVFRKKTSHSPTRLFTSSVSYSKEEVAQ